MIALEHVSKTFTTKSGYVHAVRDVSLQIDEGEIYGIIGSQRRRQVDAGALHQSAGAAGGGAASPSTDGSLLEAGRCPAAGDAAKRSA